MFYKLQMEVVDGKVNVVRDGERMVFDQKRFYVETVKSGEGSEIKAFEPKE